STKFSWSPFRQIRLAQVSACRSKVAMKIGIGQKISGRGAQLRSQQLLEFSAIPPIGFHSNEFAFRRESIHHADQLRLRTAKALPSVKTADVSHARFDASCIVLAYVPTAFRSRYRCSRRSENSPRGCATRSKPECGTAAS